LFVILSFVILLFVILLFVIILLVIPGGNLLLASVCSPLVIPSAALLLVIPIGNLLLAFAFARSLACHSERSERGPRPARWLGREESPHFLRCPARPPSPNRNDTPSPYRSVIAARLIPAGTGMEYYRNVQLSPELEEVAAQVQQEVASAIEAEERELELMRMEGEQEEMAAE
jgi:hypothetical protein